jgi:hypothetical protein
MKIGKGLGVLIFATVLGSCFDPPEFPNVPEIAFDRIEFYRGATSDSLVLYILFKDGDGDLGLNPELIEHISYPYNNLTYYQANTNGELIPLNTFSFLDTLHRLEIPNPSLGKLIFPRTRKQPGYGSLPPYSSDCPQPYEYHQIPQLVINEADSAVLDETARVVRSIDLGTSTYLLIQDTLYYTINPNHFNIEVDFLIKDPNSNDPDNPGYTEFDWREYSCTSFDARFPILSDNDAALDGTLRYRMASQFSNIFGINRTLKLRVQIKDRALNRSNVIYTNDFNLN